MKITFIHPYYFNIWEALGVAYIASFCKKNFNGVIDFSFYQSYFDSDEEIIRGAKNSDIIGFSCTSPTFNHGLKLARVLKDINPKIKTVFGGYHVSALKEMSLEEGVDQIVVGEGEKAFLEIIQGRQDEIIYGQPIDFKELSWPDRNLIKNDRTVDLCEKMIGRRIASFQANRGCPFRCVYCSEKVITGSYKKPNRIRSRDVKDLLDEIQVVSGKYNLDFFKFVDATFNVSPEYVISFCQEKIKRGFNLEWECMFHAGIAEKEIFPWLKQANCKQIDVGCESGSPKILKDMKKGVRIEQIINVFKWARENGIQRRAFFILGMPNEDGQDILLTEQLAKIIDPDIFGVTILCPYPGSDLCEHKKMRNIEWANTDEYSNDFWHSNHFTNAGLKKWQSYLTKKFEDKLAWHHIESQRGASL